MRRLLILALLTTPYSLLTAFAQDQRNVTEPIIPPVCTQLLADLAITNGEPSSEVLFDTTRIQTALNSTACTGKAVELSASGSNYAFLTKPLTLPSNVILLIDPGVTLFASRNPADYQIGTVGGTQTQCGLNATGNPNGCNPLFLSYKTTGTGIEGYGVIDGRGADTLLNASGAPLTNPYPSTCTTYTWYCNTLASHNAGANENNPMLLNPQQTSNFTLYKISLIHAPYFHMRWSGPGTGLTVWGAKLITNGSQINTDGIDPVDGITNVTITNSFISVGDDNVAITANQTTEPVSAVTISNDYFYAGDGLSIGTGLEGGVSNVVATNIYEQAEATGGETGIHLKGNTSIGGPVSNITYNGFCMQNQPYAIMINPFDTAGNGSAIPTFQNLKFQNIHVLTAVAGKNTKAQIWGYNAANITSASFDNVIFDAAPVGDPYPQYAAVTYGPGPVSPWIMNLVSSGSTDVTDTGSVTNPTESPFPCSTASFPTLIGELFASTPSTTNQHTITVNYPINITLNAVIEPPTAESPALTQPITFYDGATALANIALGANGANSTYAPLNITSATPGTHTYSALYPADSNYAAFPFGSVTVTVPAPITASANPTNLTIAPGATGQSTLTITPQANYTGTVTVTCASPVAYITCAATTPAAITGTTPTTSTITLTVAATYGINKPPTRHNRIPLLATLLPAGMLLLMRNRRKTLSIAFAILLSCLTITGLTGCGGSSSANNSGSTSQPPPAGTQTITVTTTALGTVLTTQITVNVT